MSAPTSNLPKVPAPSPADPGQNTTPLWKNEISARVRAHRTRRTQTADDQPALPGMENSGAPSSIAARVAERYSRLPSYREALAAQAAAKAAEEAAMAALEAARAAQEAARRMQAETPVVPPPPISPPPVVAAEADPDPAEEHVEPWQPDLLRYSVSSDSLPPPRVTPAQARPEATARPRSSLATVFDPLADALVEPTQPLPARVIEFPRELIAPRKARPRLAEGPLRNDSHAHASVSAGEASSDDLSLTQSPAAGPNVNSLAGGQDLRILEAEPEPDLPQASATVPDLPEWHSIQLDTEASMQQPKPSTRTSLLEGLPLYVAPLGDRAMAGLVDFSLTLAAFLLFVLVFAACTTHPPAGRVAVAGACITLLAMWVLYQILFFSLTDATPGMRYAKIALCTFDDENPTRKALRGRVAAHLLSALPLGLGFVWAVFDEDTLGWHDRITQTYQRSYRDL